MEKCIKYVTSYYLKSSFVIYMPMVDTISLLPTMNRQEFYVGVDTDIVNISVLDMVIKVLG